VAEGLPAGLGVGALRPEDGAVGLAEVGEGLEGPGAAAAGSAAVAAFVGGGVDGGGGYRRSSQVRASRRQVLVCCSGLMVALCQRPQRSQRTV